MSDPRPRAPIAAALLVAALIARGISLGADHLDELMWLCHLATAAMAIGLAAGWPRVVAGAWLYHLVWGVPVWLLDAILAGVALPSSIAAHVGPLVIGGWWLARRAQRGTSVTRIHPRLPRAARPWPGPVAIAAWLVGLAAMAATRPLTVPAHNVNAVYAVYPPMTAVFPSLASFLIANSLLSLGLMLAADRLLAGRRGVLPPVGATSAVPRRPRGL